jgi:glycosyltransferase involved in cell wall biosynthesis
MDNTAVTPCHIVVVLPDLAGGGAERLHILLAKEWVARGIRVDFVLMRRQGELIETIPAGVNLVDFGVTRIRNVLLPLTRYLRQVRPDVVLAAMWPLTTVAAAAWLLAGRQGRLFLSDHTQLSVSSVEELGLSPRLLGLAIRCSYWFADGVIAVSRGVKEDLHRLGGLPKQAVHVIYNPAATGASSERVPVEVRDRLWGSGFRHHILAVGKLKAQKDHATLLRAFALLPESLGAKLTIVGEGPLRRELEQLVKELKLCGRVALPGFTLDPYRWYRSADVFVLSSKWEGFGNVIVEALESGLPVVSTDCNSGPAEILEDGRFGRLVPVGDAPALARGISDSLQALHDRQRLIERSKVFSAPVIADQYLSCFGQKRG